MASGWNLWVWLQCIGVCVCVCVCVCFLFFFLFSGGPTAIVSYLRTLVYM